ncbi:hypothetical protein PFISCL1PPCAC_18312 [Pristionchus fissidentatus]|uniref:Uncharacterized protein n=1 Tax=Pristionchus fissidentatus TaxID=1538716 RepID=A0AAV5W9F5_9BILA|nr:hypothetical protein PFISCL1PPCAC_18312 [Pristionchus fissidentatus]
MHSSEDDTRTERLLSLESFNRIVQNVEFHRLDVTVDFNTEFQFELVNRLKLATAKELTLSGCRENRNIHGVAGSEKLNFPLIRDIMEGKNQVIIDLLCTSLSFNEIFNLREV